MARPVGKGRSLRRISDARRYHATQMPRKLTANTQGTSCVDARLPPESIARAGIGATRPPEMMLADDEAVVCVIFASPAPSPWVKRKRASRVQKPVASSSAMMEILNDQPIFSPE